MDHQLAPDRVAETLQHLDRHWEEKRKAAASRSDRLSTTPQPFAIAFSREAGTHGTAIGHEVGTRLGWPVYDHELLERIAQDMKVRTSLLENVDERRVNWLLEAFEALTSTPYASEGAYVHHLVKIVLALGSHGECVIVGRGSAFILPAETTLRVRLIAPLKDRIAAIGQQLGIPQEEATRQLNMVDRERNIFVQDHFFKDSTDPRYYDLILNVARYGVAGCAELIVASLNCLQGQAWPGTRTSVLRDLTSSA
jgi:cytidylate kinase